jgi:hypothetical protein
MIVELYGVSPDRTADPRRGKRTVYAQPTAGFNEQRGANLFMSRD